MTHHHRSLTKSWRIFHVPAPLHLPHTLSKFPRLILKMTSVEFDSTQNATLTTEHAKSNGLFRTRLTHCKRDLHLSLCNIEYQIFNLENLNWIELIYLRSDHALRAGD